MPPQQAQQRLRATHFTPPRQATAPAHQEKSCCSVALKAQWAGSGPDKPLCCRYSTRRRGKEFGAPHSSGSPPLRLLRLTSSHDSAGSASGRPHPGGRPPPRPLPGSDSVVSCGSAPGAPQPAGSSPPRLLLVASRVCSMPMAAHESGSTPLSRLSSTMLQQRRCGEAARVGRRVAAAGWWLARQRLAAQAWKAAGQAPAAAVGVEGVGAGVGGRRVCRRAANVHMCSNWHIGWRRSHLLQGLEAVGAAPLAGEGA